jgi:hypothetical protein
VDWLVAEAADREQPRRAIASRPFGLVIALGIVLVLVLVLVLVKKLRICARCHSHAMVGHVPELFTLSSFELREHQSSVDQVPGLIGVAQMTHSPRNI